MELRKTKKMDITIKRTNFQLVALFLCATVFLGLNNRALSQNEPSITLDHSAGYLKKVEKSPAKALILTTDTLIAKAIEAKSSYGNSEEVVKHRRTLISNSFTIKENKTKISELDPNWKMDKIDAHLDEFQAYYRNNYKPEVSYLNAEYSTFFNAKFDLSRFEGQALYDYVTGKDEGSLQLEVIHQKIAELVTLKNRYPEIMSFTISNYYVTDRIRTFVSTCNKADLNEPLEERFNKPLMLQQYGNAIPEGRAYLILDPQNEGLLTLMPKMEKNYEILKKELSNFFVSPFHQKNVGKTFLSNHRINFGNETEADFTTEFKEGEPVFVVHYLTKPSSMDKSSFEFKFPWMDVVYLKTGPLNDKFGDEQKVNVFQFALVPPLNDTEIPNANKADVNKVVESVSKPSSTRHTCVLVHFDNKKLEFTIDYSENKHIYEAILKEIGSLQGDLVKISKAGMTDGSVDAEIKKFLAKVDESELNFKGCTVVKSIIIPTEWEYEKEPYTNKIDNRYLRQVHVICKDENNKCFMLSVDYKQFMNGGSYGTPLIQVSSVLTFGPEFIAADSNNRLYFNCSKL